MSNRLDAPYDVIVIGAGHNGLTTAAFLARQKYRVLVLERRASVGGTAAREPFYENYLRPGLLHDTSCVSPGTVRALGLESYGLQWRDAPPLFVPQAKADGPGLLLDRDPARTALALSAKDTAQYAAYMEFVQKLKGFVGSLVDKAPLPLQQADKGGLLSLAKAGFDLRRLGKKTMMELLRIGPMCTGDWLDEWFDNDLLKVALAAPAHDGTYTGPRSPGSNAALLLRECTTGKAIVGGPGALIDALVISAKQGGATIRTEADVQQLLLDQDRVCGVKLKGGEEIRARVIAASCDPKHTFLQLLPPQELPRKLEERILQYRSRGTTAKVNLALKRAVRFACRPDHTIEFARTGEHLLDIERAFDAVKYRQYSQRPILDIYVPTHESRGMAPIDHHVMSILVHFAPYQHDPGWDRTQADKLGETVLTTLTQYIPDLRDAIVAKEVMTPLDIERHYGLTEGHILHGEPALDQLLFRPIPECARYTTPLSGLFLCGSGSHPGGGLTCRPGTLAAHTIEAALSQTF